MQTRDSPVSPRHGLARVLSKLGLCSRTEAEAWIRAGRVQFDGRVVLDPEHPATVDVERIRIDGEAARCGKSYYLLLNKPRGLVTTARDERGRDTVYRCFEGAGLPWLAPVGRLDQASEGLLLFSNDPGWAARITSPETGPDKTYRVQVQGIPDGAALERLRAGITDRGEHLAVKSATLLQHGARNAWLELVLDEGRNRHLRRLLSACGFPVLRLVRVAIGDLLLGELAKGQWRELTVDEVRALAEPGR